MVTQNGVQGPPPTLREWLVLAIAVPPLLIVCLAIFDAILANVHNWW